MQTNNPILWADYPDPDVIRVDDVYYMISTAMHMFPGGQILRSRDLARWEHAGYVYDRLDDTPVQSMDGGMIYGKGMWAATLRYHQKLFHVLFVCNDTKKTYHFTAEQTEGPWTRHPIRGFYHDASLLFDDDGRVYLAYGNREIRIAELEPDLSGPRAGGEDRVVLTDTGNVRLGYEGSHFYKINGKYCLFCIHWPNDGFGRRTQACFVSASPMGPYTGGDIVDDDLDFRNQGVAQGGVIDTPAGDWYLMLFQDHGAVGRAPVLVPMTWKNDYPVAGKIPRRIEIPGTAAEPPCAPLFASDSLRQLPLNACWQWNHQPHNALWTVSGAGMRLTTDRVANGLEQAVNTLTQRAYGPACETAVTVDGWAMNPGDFAGLCALQSCYCQLAIARQERGFTVSLITREPEEEPAPFAPSPEPALERAHAALAGDTVTLKLRFDFADMRDIVTCFYRTADGWKQLWKPHRLVYRLDHFMGVRAGLFLYATRVAGGSAVFSDFIYRVFP